MLVQFTLLDLRQHSADPADVTPEELERAARFLREEDRQRYLLGRTVIRRLCAAHFGCAPAEVQFQQNEQGKPFIAPSPGIDRLEFNLAHSGDCVALAWSIGATAAVGIDVETIQRQRTPDFQGIARTAFSLAERSVLAAAGPGGVAATFYKIWVRKEAIVKAEGCGIAAGNSLQQFTVAMLDEAGAVHWPRLVDFPGGQHWELYPLSAPAGYEVVLAAMPGAKTRSVDWCRETQAR
jgi:4'-phosphopantetheinyl transferase